MPLDDQNFIASMRGLAILVIVFGHVGGYWAFQPFSSYLHSMGSTFFFFLSGAVLYHSYSRARSTFSYMVNRFLNLLTPYYLICLLALVVYFVNNNKLPLFDIDNLFAWLIVHPVKEMMPFPLGQLWFLRTYLLLFIISPLIFYFYKKSIIYIFSFYGVILILTILQRYFFIFNEDSVILLRVYSLFFYSCFFTYGAILYSGEYEISSNVKWLLVIIPLVFFITNLESFDISDSFTKKDIIALSSTFVVAGITYFYKNEIILLLKKFTYLLMIFKFYHKHTFSVYLLHSFTIYVTEKYFGLVDPPIKNISYGLTKFTLVIIFCSILAVPFTNFSKIISRKLLYTIDNVKL